MLQHFLFFTLALFTYTAGIAQSHEKLQTIAMKSANEVVINAADSDFYNFSDNQINENSVIIKIKVSSETFPSSILKAMMEQGDFNIRYKVSSEKLVISQLKKSQDVRYEGKTHKIDFNYEISVPMSLAYEE